MSYTRSKYVLYNTTGTGRKFIYFLKFIIWGTLDGTATIAS